MPEIDLTETQYERLEAVREDVEEAFVDDYGYIPIKDAVEYLLDTYTPPEKRGAADAYEQIATAEYPQLQRVASEVPEVPGSGIDADEMRGKLLAELGTEQFAAKLSDAIEADETGTEPDTASSNDTTTATEAEHDPQTDPASVGESDIGTAPDAAGATESTDGSETAGESAEQMSATGGGNPLATANRLLGEHDEKWRESGGDEPYEVDLPDGTTESARTKDDVRQLLFRHY